MCLQECQGHFYSRAPRRGERRERPTRTRMPERCHGPRRNECNWISAMGMVIASSSRPACVERPERSRLISVSARREISCARPYGKGTVDARGARERAVCFHGRGVQPVETGILPGKSESETGQRSVNGIRSVSHGTSSGQCRIAPGSPQRVRGTEITFGPRGLQVTEHTGWRK